MGDLEPLAGFGRPPELCGGVGVQTEQRVFLLLLPSSLTTTPQISRKKINALKMASFCGALRTIYIFIAPTVFI